MLTSLIVPVAVTITLVVYTLTGPRGNPNPIIGVPRPLGWGAMAAFATGCWAVATSIIFCIFRPPRDAPSFGRMMALACLYGEAAPPEAARAEQPLLTPDGTRISLLRVATGSMFGVTAFGLWAPVSAASLLQGVLEPAEAVLVALMTLVCLAWTTVLLRRAVHPPAQSTLAAPAVWQRGGEFTPDPPPGRYRADPLDERQIRW